MFLKESLYHFSNQLYDVLGYVQTKDSHEAVMKKLHFDKEEQLDLSERYLWALSFSSQPNPDIIKDLLNKYSKLVNIPEKVKETLILTVASMAYKLTKLPENSNYLKLVRDVEEIIVNHLDYAKGEDRYVFFRALRNLQSKSSVPLLLKYIKDGTQKEGVLSWKAIKSFEPNLWTTDVLEAAMKSLFQLDRRYDSSSRTLAADILIESKPTDELLEDLLNFLLSNDPAFETKQYVFQRIKMIADDDPLFRERVQKIIKKNDKINNYSGLSPRGLSVALTRSFMKSPSSNGSLVSVQEMKSGIVKRGTVNILGIFSGGLNSFISSETETEEEQEESATAGMELTVLGTQIRPFVFFDGQGELMGHVWSGTASERTTAFQALALLHDHLEYLRLGSGFIAELNLKGATAGIVLIGLIKIDTSFVKSQVEFSASIEPKLTLQTDIDFSSNVHLCMRLAQPDSIFRHNVYKIERIPGSKHKLRISKYKKTVVPGRTYSLNRKNNEMCSAIFS
ncbi:hypothetical protein NQ314_010350 [Rhamnusium bicolor]|uniref:Microsomal triglyceride transfer protein large subunit n=1 Tax=Rhamnusium bicolor TaxID=1586634 RepID=A0AAV8XT93_9CUCU|nr:hypothetical protein NQ314_010350 [Rhamnusium bicolor]